MRGLALLPLLGAVLAPLPHSPSPVASRTESRVVTGVAWHDLITRDLDKSRTFYEGVFGWTFGDVIRRNQKSFVFASVNGTPVAGFQRADDATVASQWITYIAVADLKGMTRAATEAGGKVVVKTSVVLQETEGTILTDPQGAPFGLIEGRTAEADGDEARENTWIWHELFTKDIEAAVSYYEKVFGVTRGDAKVGKVNRILLRVGDRPVVGVLEVPDPEVRPNWLPMLKVPDIAKVLERTKALGGRVIMAPSEEVRNGTVAIIADPAGAAVGVQQVTTGK